MWVVGYPKIDCIRGPTRGSEIRGPVRVTEVRSPDVDVSIRGLVLGVWVRNLVKVVVELGSVLRSRVPRSEVSWGPGFGQDSMDFRSGWFICGHGTTLGI